MRNLLQTVLHSTVRSGIDWGMQLTFRRFDLRLTRPWVISTGLGGGGGDNPPGVMFVEISDAEGRRGLGEGAPSARYEESVGTVAAFLKKIDPGRLSFQDVPGSQRYLETIAPGDHTAKC